MRHILLVVAASLIGVGITQSQEKSAWGSLSGKITRPDSKKPIADAIVFLKSSDGHFPIHADDKVRKDLEIQIPAGRAFEFRMLAHYPRYYDGNKYVSTGQKFVLVGDTMQDHGIGVTLHFTTTKMEAGRLKVMRAIAKDDFLRTTHFVGAGQKETVDFKFLAGYVLQSSYYREIKTHVFVFDHPYFAITQKDGSFRIPRVPAGQEVFFRAWHEDIGHVTKTDEKISFKRGENVLDIQMK